MSTRNYILAHLRCVSRLRWGSLASIFTTTHTSTWSNFRPDTNYGLVHFLDIMHCE